MFYHRSGFCNVLKSFRRNFCIALGSDQNVGKWDLLSAVCLERKPTLSRELNDLEKRFSLYLARMERDKSMKSDHEVRHELDLKNAEMIKKGDPIDVDAERGGKQTAEDFEDICEEELKKFTFATRDPDPNVESDFHSLKRKQERNLLFVVEEKLGENLVWMLPQGKRQDGEALHETAERILQQYCGGDLKASFYGYAPCGFYKYRYPKIVCQNSTDSVGAKIFFFKAQYLGGSLSPKSVKDYRWLGRNELVEHLPKDYYKSVMKFIIDED